MVSGACLWVSKRLWVELGGLPACFGSLAEDMHLCTLARLRGYPVQVLPTSGFFHHVGKNLGGGRVLENNRLATNKNRRTLSERNKSFVIVMTYPAPLLQFVLPIHLLLLLLEGVILAFLKQDRYLFYDIYLSCIKSLWHQRKALFQLRSEIQAKRKITCRSFLYPFQIIPYKLTLLFKYGLPDFIKK
jgi:GT2 family glycosyltransferase